MGDDTVNRAVGRSLGVNQLLRVQIRWITSSVLYFVCIGFNIIVIKIQRSMRGSPIRNIKNREFGESPYHSILHNQSGARHSRSPVRVDPTYNSSAEEYWKSRAKTLEAEVLGLNEEVMFQQRRIEKIDELEEKIEVLLAQNSHLVDENESLIHLIQQKKAEVESWKVRFEGEYTHSNVAEAEKRKIFDHLNLKDQEHQVQVDKLLAEISRLHDEIQGIESLKQIEMNQLRSKYENEALNQIQNLKRSQYGNSELQQLNICKLRDVVKDREFQIENLRRESKLENERLNGEIAYLKNEIKKVEQQKVHQADLVRTENENTKNNLSRANKKNEEELRNLHEAKVRRLTYELEEKKAEVEDLHAKAKRGGKENEAELSNIIGEKQKLRIEIKESDNRNRNQIAALTEFYERQLAEQSRNHADNAKSLTAYFQADIGSLKAVIAAKQAEIERLLTLNAELRQNEESRLRDIKANNAELRQKAEDLVMHYEREIELMKIKVSQLYEADLEALRSKLRNMAEAKNRECENLRGMLEQLRAKLADTVQEKVEMRVDFENRVDEFKVVHERDVQVMRDQIAMHEKNYENQTSKASLTHISHNNMIQQKNVSSKELMAEKRNLEKQIDNKNKEIGVLNLRLQKVEGFHKNETAKLEKEIAELKGLHQDWLDGQAKQSEEWNQERSQLKEKCHDLDLRIKRQNDAFEEKEEKLRKQVEQKGRENAELKGILQEYESKVGVMHGDIKVAAEGAEKTRLENEALLNVEKDRYVQSKDVDRDLRSKEFTRVQDRLQKSIDDLRRENELLREADHEAKIREADLKTEIGHLLDSVNKRSQLEESVINIGLSNNYFKNVAEIFKKQLPS